MKILRDESAEKIVNQAPISMAAWLRRRAQKLSKARDFAGLISCLTRLLRLLTASKADVADLARVHYQLGLAHRALRDHRKSLYHFKFSVRLNEGEAKYHQAFGKAFMTGGQLKVAQAQFEKALELAPQNPVYLRQYAWLLIIMGKKAQARRFALKALRETPMDPETLMIWIRVCLECEMFVAADLAIRKVKKIRGSERRVATLESICREQLSVSFEGMTLKYLRSALDLSPQVFHIGDLRRAESIWKQVCISGVSTYRVGKPQVWAAAMIYVVLYEKDPWMMSLEMLLEKFGTTTAELFPFVKRIQRFQELVGHQWERFL